MNEQEELAKVLCPSVCPLSYFEDCDNRNGDCRFVKRIAESLKDAGYCIAKLKESQEQK